MAKKCELEAALKEFCSDIEAAGGVAFGQGGPAPIGDLAWTDLGQTYVKACKLLGRPVVFDTGDGDDS
jgi:hypothetical protein